MSYYRPSVQWNMVGIESSRGSREHIVHRKRVKYYLDSPLGRPMAALIHAFCFSPLSSSLSRLCVLLSCVFLIFCFCLPLPFNAIFLSINTPISCSLTLSHLLPPAPSLPPLSYPSLERFHSATESHQAAALSTKKTSACLCLWSTSKIYFNTGMVVLVEVD